MYLVLSILFGFFLGSYFYICLERNAEEQPKHRVVLLMVSIGIMGIVGGMEYVCAKNISIQSLCIMVTLLVLGFEAVSDVVSMQTYTIPIYVASAMLTVIQIIYSFHSGGIIEGIYQVLIIMLWAVGCVLMQHLLSDKIGGGDFDIAFLISFTEPLITVALLITALITYMFSGKKKTEKKNKNNLKEVTVYQKEIPLVPFLLLEYIVFLLLVRGGI